MGDRLPPPPSSSDELSSFLRQILSRSPTTQSYSPPDTANQPPKRIVSTGEMFDRSSPAVYGGEVSSVAGDDVCAHENKRNGAKQRNSLKRNNDAQFHNLSEKRRRSKINEKMKALQKLLPNSSKTDKASMLDEAIEYLKQLQLQVQALTVMNGLGLNPMRLPPVLLPTQTRINETLEPDLNLETMLGASHLLANREPLEANQQMCFSTATLL